jgi:hypothetical protein
MGSTVGLVSMVAAGVCAAIGIFLFRRKKLFALLLGLAALFLALPFVRYAVLTRDAYDWTIVVRREMPGDSDARVIYIREIQWITDYEILKRVRGDVGSLLLNKDRTGKTWTAKGYIPLSIRADVLYGSDNAAISRSFSGLEAGSYTFTLTFDENDSGSWDIRQTDG